MANCVNDNVKMIILERQQFSELKRYIVYSQNVWMTKAYVGQRLQAYVPLVKLNERDAYYCQDGLTVYSKTILPI